MEPEDTLNPLVQRIGSYRQPRAVERVLITGVAGFIGSHVAQRYLEQGTQVVGLDSLDDYYAVEQKLANLGELCGFGGFTFVHGDIRDKELLADTLATGNFDTFVHLAARAGVRPSIESPGLYVDVNVSGTLAVLEALRQYPEIRLVFASSSSVYGGLTHTPFAEQDEASQPVSPYAATKKAGELLCHTWHHLYNIPITMLRFFTVYGPRQRPDMAIAKFARLILDDKPIPVFGDGSTARDYTFIDDIVDGIVASAERTVGLHLYNLGESQTVALNYLVSALGTALGKAPRIEHLPMQPGDVEITCANVGRAKREIGYHPTTSIEVGLARYVDWLLASRWTARKLVA